MDRVDSHALVVLSSLLQDGTAVLPNGEFLQAQPGFRVLSLGLYVIGGGCTHQA